MSIKYVEEAKSIFSFVSHSGSIEELCKRLVYSPKLMGTFQGANFLVLDRDNQLRLETRCGASISSNQAALILFRGKESQSILDTRPRYETFEELRILVFPILRNSVPFAFLTLTLTSGTVSEPIGLDSLEIVQSAGALIHDSLPLYMNRSRANKPLPEGFTLSDRHKTIVSLIKDGLTNNQIGRELSLSASIIRQENVKIFKFFGVSSRRELAQVSITD
jgi:DNA-binding CsgD family transcriptional regulator